MLNPHKNDCRYSAATPDVCKSPLSGWWRQSLTAGPTQAHDCPPLHLWSAHLLHSHPPPIYLLVPKGLTP